MKSKLTMNSICLTTFRCKSTSKKWGSITSSCINMPIVMTN